MSARAVSKTAAAASERLRRSPRNRGGGRGRCGLEGLALLRSRIRAARVPEATPVNLRLATWNVRELGKKPRWGESVRMIAEIMRAFDFVSVVELRDDIGDLRRVLAELGPAWSAVFSDYRLDAGGNRERVGFVFDRRRVEFTGLASSAEAQRYAVDGGHHYLQSIPWWRPPFLASFRLRGDAAGGRELVVVAAHVRWGKTVRAREREVIAVGDWLARRAEEAYFRGRDVLVVGDFNLAKDTSVAFHALAEHGLVAAPGLDSEQGTNLAGGKRYDRILLRSARESPIAFTGRSGALDFYQGEHRTLFSDRELTKDAFTYQLSDHFPLWTELSNTRRR